MVVANTAQSEVYQKQPKILIIDDDQCIKDIIITYIGCVYPDLVVSHFFSAKVAIQELSETYQNESVPTIVIIDGQLKGDTMPFCHGHAVVSHLRQQPYSDQLYLIAHSSDPCCLSDMCQSGADISVQKAEFSQLMSAIRMGLSKFEL